jgi:hypothetical protein
MPVKVPVSRGCGGKMVPVGGTFMPDFGGCPGVFRWLAKLARILLGRP